MHQTLYISGRYETEENILYLWSTRPIILNDAETLGRFFREVTLWIKTCPAKPYLLTNFSNLQIAVEMTNPYAEQVKIFRPLVHAIFRFGMSEELNGRFTAMAVRMGNMKNSASSNIYPDEATARQAIREFKQQHSQLSIN